ncbi:hypothetical protein L1049_006373 [Liquidambar formosana]|uniref:Methyltransferase type 11 domain-containing protein n=1 Tax=Liquidambar formosana TaxID=63359 RepID=A0AAP0WTP1_LIQFO
MTLYSSRPFSSLSFDPNTRCPSGITRRTKFTYQNHVRVRSDSSPTLDNSESPTKKTSLESSCAGRFCSCRRRHLIQAAATALLPISPSKASDFHYDYTAMLNRVHPPRPDWYEEFYASVLNTAMEPYEAEVSAHFISISNFDHMHILIVVECYCLFRGKIAGYKLQLFTNLKGKAKKVLEIGIGTGPNLKYYASDTDVQVFGIDPNRKMEKYAKAAAVAAGMPPANFKFLRAVGEALPLNDASVDAVVGTLVLCSVKDVDLALKEVKRVLKPGGLYLFVEHVAAKDGTFLRVLQNVVDPLQQTVSDGCHLTRETGKSISEAGFSGVDINTTLVSNATLISPHVYGIACK